MKRIGIFSVFDEEGKIDQYVLYLGHSLKKMVDRLIIVVNNNLDEYQYSKLKELSSEVICRENTGFDGGAYTYVFKNFLTVEELYQYDELILCNDTCYGPFVDFEEIWKKMDEKKVDFWGLNYIDNGLTNHLQAYFLVFKKVLLMNNVVYDYFINNVDDKTQDLHEIIATFEKGLWKYLVELGYNFRSYIKCNNLNMYEAGNVLIKDYGFPVLKKKCFDVKYNKEISTCIDALEWIKNNSSYDKNMILENANRLYDGRFGENEYKSNECGKIKRLPVKSFSVSREQMKGFINEASNIYIYGCGKYAKEIYFLYLKHNYKFQGFIVSDNVELRDNYLYDFPIKHYNEVPDDVAIIIATNEKNRREITKNLIHQNVIYIV